MSKKELSEEKGLQNNPARPTGAGGEETTDAVSRVYELGYLLIPTIAVDDVAALYTSLKDLLSGLGANLIADEMPKMIPLAYQMLKVTQNVRSKFDNAYFGWIKFELDADKVLSLKTKLDLDPNYLRFLLIKTVKENTIATKKFTYSKDALKKKPYGAKKEGEVEGVEGAPINKEEIDKEIDAMVEA